MTQIHEANQTYPFEQLSLANPHGIQGGAFFSTLLLNEEHPCLFQTPKCLTKNGIIRTGKKTYCDLIIASTNDTFLNFLQEFEKRIQQLIYEKRNLWFHNDMEMENIEYFFNPVLRTYKKQYLIRAYVQQPKHIKNLNSLQIYDENENILSLNDVTKENKIISIVEGLGIKFTSSSFHLELCLRQVMVLKDKPLFEKCLIQTDRNSFISSHQAVPLIANNEKCINLSKKTDPPSENTTPNLEKVCDEDKKENDNTEKKITETSLENSNEEENIEYEITEIENQEKEGDIATDSEDEKADTSNIKEEEVKEEDKVEKEAIQEEEEKKKEDNLDNNKEKKDDKQNQEETAIEDSINDLGTLVKKDTLCEIKLDLPPEEDPIQLKKPIEVYREIYSHAVQKAKLARKQYIQAFLEAKRIKNTFLSSEIEDSDDDLDNFEEIEE